MAQCLFPYYVERKLYVSQEGRTVPVPCGKCPECLKRRSLDWSFRIEKESLRHSRQFFVTLTYSPEECPISANNFMTLNKHHVQKYIKRLRKNTGSKFVYYMCGEYGTRYKRPHYHFIILGDDNLSDTAITKAWINPDSGFIFGNVYFGEVTPASIRYTVQYYDKGDWRPMHSRDDREPEFSLMSKGLGKNFLTNETVNFIRKNPDRQYLYDQGLKIAIPRYYRRRVFEYRGTEKLIRLHPSILTHFDELDRERKIRNQITKNIQDEREQPDPANREWFERRKAAINNYRKSKRKTRD